MFAGHSEFSCETPPAKIKYWCSNCDVTVQSKKKSSKIQKIIYTIGKAFYFWAKYMSRSNQNSQYLERY